MGIYVYIYLYVYIRHMAHTHMLHLPADYPGTANTPFTLQPKPDEETNLQTVQDVLQKAKGSSWAASAPGRAKHPATGSKASAQGIYAPQTTGKGDRHGCRLPMEDMVLSLLLQPPKATS